MDVLDIVNEALGGILGDIPTHNTIGNWIKKYGLDVYNSSGKYLEDKDYCGIVDESMMIGSEKLLVTIGVPSTHQGVPLSHQDASILDLSISKSWSGEKIKERLDDVKKKVGHAPEYVISDNASTMNKGIRLFGVNWHRDISHSLGMYLARTYEKDTEFCAYIKCMNDVKYKYNMTNVAYLLPPSQRSIARFMNFSDWVEWSARMLNNYHTFSFEEKKIFSFVPAYASLIDELSEVMSCIQTIERICKQQGLSKASIRLCQKQIRQKIFTANNRMINLGEDIWEFLNVESKIIESDQAVHNNSSDLLESLFGMYKARKSPNKLQGVTSFILFIPAYTQLAKEKKKQHFQFKKRLERIRLKDISIWSAQKLSSNLVAKRTQILKRTG